MSLLHSLRSLAVHDRFHPSTLLNVFANRVFGRPVLLLVLCPTLMWRLPPALVHSCRMAFPFPLEIWNHCYDILRVGTLLYVRIRHSVASYNLQYYLLHFPLTSLEHPLFLVCERPFLCAVYYSQEYTGFQNGFLSPVFGICWPV